MARESGEKDSYEERGMSLARSITSKREKEREREGERERARERESYYGFTSANSGYM